DFGLRLVVEVVAAPGPGVAGGRLLRGDDDAAQLALDLRADGVAFVWWRLERLDAQVRLVHQEVVTVEPMPAGLLVAERPGAGDWGAPPAAAVTRTAARLCAAHFIVDFPRTLRPEKTKEGRQPESDRP